MRRVVLLVALCAIGVALVRLAVLAGDGVEYYSMLESLFRHASPDQRPEDVEHLRHVLGAHGVALAYPHDGFFVSPNGRWYSYHFWLYPLACVPAKAVLHALGSDEFRAPAWTNALLFVAAIAYGLRRPPTSARVAFLVLAATGPIVWYVLWPHAEVFTWALVTTSLCAYDEKRYARASLLAACASTQATPIAALLVVYVAAPLAVRRWRDAAGAASFASVAALPAIFFASTFGHPNLIVATGMASPGFMTAKRVASLFVDPEHGMLPYVPLTLVFAVWGVARATRRKRLEAPAFAAVAIAMACGAAQTCNFNAGCAALHRYATWIVPVVAFAAARGLAWGPWGRRGLALAFAGQLAIVATLRGEDDAHLHTALGRLVLEHAPGFWDPDPETFLERTLGRPLDAPFKPAPLPVAFEGSRGVTKILADDASLDRLEQTLLVDDARWLARARAAHRSEQGWFYLEPPPHAVRRRPPPRPGDVVSLGGGWWLRDGVSWMGARGTIVIHRALLAGRPLRLEGAVPQAITRRPTIRLRAGDVELDRFVATLERFTREVRLADGDDDLVLTLESSETFALDGRAYGIAVTASGAVAAEHAVGGASLHFDAGWHPSIGAPPDDVRCIGRAASVRVDASPEARSLYVWPISPEMDPQRPSSWRVTLDGRELERGPVFRTARRAWTLPPGADHVLEIETDSVVAGGLGLCFAALRVDPETPPPQKKES